MRPDVIERLPAYVLGALPEDEQRELDALVAASAPLQEEVARITEALLGVAEGVPPIEPPDRVRARLLRAVGGVDRFQPFLAEIGRRFDMAVDSVRALLARIDDPAAWEPGPLPFIRLQHFAAGPGVPATDAGLVKVAAGHTFPRHRHLGWELTIVLEGAMREGGRVYRPGDAVERQADDPHEYVADGARDLVLIAAHNGIVPIE